MTSTPPPASWPPPTAGDRRRPGWLVPLVAVSAVVLAACCIGSVAIVATSDDDTGTGQPAAGRTGATPAAATQDPTERDGTADQPPPDSPAPEPEPEPEPEGFGAGTWEVGAEIPSGTYVTTAPDGGAFAGCYWARLSGFTGDLDQIIANGNLNPGARGRITITESDTGVELTGDCRWVAAADADPIEIGAEVGEGTWAVGEEIQPRTYTTNAPDGSALDGCYWARLSGFTGEFDQIIANGNIEAGAHGRVQISSSDAGVQFTGACSWTRN